MEKKYKNLEDIAILFNQKVWNSLHKLIIGYSIMYNGNDTDGYDGICIIKDKMFARYQDGADGINGLCASWNEEEQVWLVGIPRGMWISRLESFGYFHK
ncbi:hypothetical protein [Fusobacterium sp. SYSU M8D902]|uniref:hypothetical protein n=1 Tax=Fusobacterium sp. SYSU M8D902 TaxID=3159562 RepID=UPI0032E39E53